MSFNKLLISVLVLAAVAIPASATTTYYCSNGCGANNETAFNNAAAALGLVFGTSFESVTPNGSDPSGLLNADSTTGLDFFGYDGATQDGVTVTGGVLGQTTSGGGTTLQAQLPAGIVYAFAGNISATSASAPCFETAGVVASGNCNNTVVISGSSDSEFFGVLSSSPLASVYLGTFNGNPGSLQIDSFELGEQGAPTPEAATLIMISSGLIVMGWLKRRANYKRAAAASSRNQVAAPPLRVANCAG